MSNIHNLNICPVCGYDQLEEPPYDEYGYPSHEICPSCNYEYGFDDSSEGHTFEQYRLKWIEKGFQFNQVECQPENWNKEVMEAQLKNVKKVTFKPRI